MFSLGSATIKPAKYLLLLLSLLALSPQAFAAVVTIDATQSNPNWELIEISRIDGVDITPAGGPITIDDNTAYTTGLDSGFINEIAFYSIVEADTNGKFMAEASTSSFIADGISTQADFEWVDTFSNTGLAAANYLYDMNIDSGYFFIDSRYYEAGAIAAGIDGVVSYSLEVLLDGVSLWNSSASLSSLTGLTQSGTDIGGVLSAAGNSFDWAATTETVDLGVIDAGSSASLTYRMSLISTTYGNAYDGGGTAASVQFGDPFSISSVGNTLRSEAVSVQPDPVGVPEPETLFLLLVGLLGMVATSKRRV